MYNAEYKNAYMDSLNISEISKKQYNAIFRNTSELEKRLNKDLYDMTFDELEMVFYAPKYRKINTMINYINKIKSYITWAKVNGYGESKDNPIIVSINQEFVNKYVFHKGTVYFTRNDIIECLDNIVNVQHKALILCLFEGIKGCKYEEIINMKHSDLVYLKGRFCVNLTINERSKNIIISKKLYYLLNETYHNKYFITRTGKKINVLDCEYVFRRSSTKSKGICNFNYASIGNIMNNFIKPSLNNINVNANYIYNSGLMYKINYMMGKDRILSKEIADQIIKEYGLTTLKVNGREYSSYTSLKKIIDVDFINDAYGFFKMEI